MRRVATAIAFVLVAAGASAFVGTPAVTQDEKSLHASAASSSNCPDPADFEIAEKHGDANSRTLLGGEEEIGLADVAAGTPEKLRVDLETSSDELDVEVFEMDGDICKRFDAGQCHDTVTQTGHRKICTLDDPDSGTKNYWAHFTNNETADSLTYHTWTPDA